MRHALNHRLNRRQFVQGAAAVTGAAILTPQGIASALLSAERKLSVAFWNGTRFELADRLPSGDPSLAKVILAVTGVGAVFGVTALDVMFRVGDGTSRREVPFGAWSPGSATSTIQVPVRGSDGIKLVAHWDNGSTTSLWLGLSKAKGALIREGVFVLAESLPDLARLALTGEVEAPLLMDGEPARFGYILLRVERA